MSCIVDGVDIVIAEDDPRRDDVRALIAEHLADMRARSPEGSVHALDIEALVAPGMTFWTARREGALLGTAALKALSVDGELKSMRTSHAARRTGVARLLLEHAIAAAAARGWRRLWLETGSQEFFTPARSLYASRGFVECEAFEGYTPDPASTFMVLRLEGETAA